MRFDNTKGRGQDGRRLRGHFAVKAQGVSLCYCYIRKNACTAFKRLFMDYSPYRKEHNPGDNPLVLMSRRHRIRTVEELAGIPHRIFVYRDPLERIASIYLNKFVLRDGADDILSSFEAVTGRSGQDASFSDFVHEYLGARDLDRLDPHVLPQAAHLAPILYSDAIPIVRLQSEMSKIIGVDLAQKYFARKINDTASFASLDAGPWWTSPARTLREHFEESRALPKKADLLSESLREILRQLYHADIDLFARLSGEMK